MTLIHPWNNVISVSFNPTSSSTLVFGEASHPDTPPDTKENNNRNMKSNQHILRIQLRNCHHYGSLHIDFDCLSHRPAVYTSDQSADESEILGGFFCVSEFWNWPILLAQSSPLSSPVVLQKIVEYREDSVSPRYRLLGLGYIGSIDSHVIVRGHSQWAGLADGFEEVGKELHTRKFSNGELRDVLMPSCPVSNTQ